MSPSSLPRLAACLGEALAETECLFVALQVASPGSLFFFRSRGRLHVVNLHPVLEGLQADRHLGQHADGLFLSFGRLSIADAFKFFVRTI